ncbi:MAG: helix-turn-helix domain-containing protein [Victivallaceae bacterium]|nr:helix-turn-helix domain-containing protein [Victivallaceae bacterium]
MKIKSKITPEIIAAVTSLLAPFVEDLTPTKLIAALEAFEDIDSRSAERLEKPFTIAEACKLLQVSKPTIYRMFADGTIKKVRIRNSIRIPASAIHSILNP